MEQYKTFYKFYVREQTNAMLMQFGLQMKSMMPTWKGLIRGYV